MNVRSWVNRHEEIGWAIVLSDSEMRRLATRDPEIMRELVNVTREAYLAGEAKDEA